MTIDQIFPGGGVLGGGTCPVGHGLIANRPMNGRCWAEQFIKEQLDEEWVINIAETSDAYASTATIW